MAREVYFGYINYDDFFELVEPVTYPEKPRAMLVHNKIMSSTIGDKTSGVEFSNYSL